MPFMQYLFNPCSQLSCEAAMSTMLSYLREENLRLLRENDELRDLCCFLDDDRQKVSSRKNFTE